MAISTNGTVIARLAGGLYNTVMSNATYLEVASQDPSTLANTLYARDFAKSTDLAVATTLVTNLGLSSVAGLANWVAAQLTAAGAANKGAKIVSLLNDFAGLTADTTYGAAATAFNTKVDAALAASQKTGAASGVFADAGTVAVANATFTLTTGADTFTGGAGNDSFVATGATLTTGDVLTGQAGDSLTITDLAASFAAGLPANVTVTGIPTATITTTGKLGASTALATGYSQTLTFTDSVSQKTADYQITPSNSTTPTSVTATNATLQSSDTTGSASADAAVTALTSLYNKLGYVVTATGSAPTASNTVDIKKGTVGTETTPVTIKGAPGITIPTPLILNANDNGNIPVSSVTAAGAAVSSAPFAASGWTGLTSLTATSAGGANISAAKTTDVNLTNTSGTATVSGGLGVTVAGTTNSVYVSGAAGAVKVTATVPASGFGIADTSASGTGTLTGMNGSWGTYSWSGATGTLTAVKAGVVVTGGTTVSVTEAGGTIVSSAVDTTNSTDIRVGSAVQVSSAGSTIGQETIRNSSLAPVGDVTISRSTNYTDANGLKNVVYGTGVANIYTNGASTVSVTGSTSVVVTDINTTKLVPSTGVASVAGTSKLTTVNLSGLSGGGTHTITSDAISTVSLSNTQTAETISIANSGTLGANSGAINVQLSNVGKSVSGTITRAIISDATATSVNVSSGAATAYDYTGSTASNTGSKSYVTLTAAKATAINLANSLAVDIGDYAATSTKVATINASSATGAVAATIAATPEQGTSFTGGAGNDVVTIKASADLSANATSAAVTTVSLGAGNDTLLNGGTTALTFTGATFNGGDGNDTVAVSLITVGNAAKFTNFETLGLDLTSATTRDASLLGGVTGLSLLANSSGTVTYSGLTTDKGLTVGTTMGNASGVTSLDFGSTVTGTTDAYTVTFAGAGTSSPVATPTPIDAAIVKIAGIEAVTIASGGTGYTNNTISLSDTSARTLTITGSQKTGVTFDTAFGTVGASTTSAGVSSIDASALTGKLTLNTTNVKTAYAGLSVKGGSNDDTITIANQSDDGGNTPVYNGRVTVDAGAGNDTITTASKSSTLTGGAGNDSFVVTNTTAGSAYATAPEMTTITDFAAGDTITMGNVTAVSLKAVGTVNVANATSLTDAFTKALYDGTTYIANNTAVWFVYGGSTYIVANDTNNGFGSGDIIVKLSGVTTTDLAYGSSTGLVGAA